MTLKPSDQQRIIANESAWVDSSFGGLDLSQFPDLNTPPPTDTHDDRFARHWSDRPFNGSELRSFIENPDVDAMQETGSADLLRDVRDRRAEEVVRAFKRACPEYLPTDQNFHDMLRTLNYNAFGQDHYDDADELIDRLIIEGFWSVDNLTRVFEALDREGILQKPLGEPRNLSNSERLRVSRLAQSGKIDEAIGFYLRASLDGEEPTMDMINDPKYRDVCDSAVWEVWENITHDYTPTPEREAFIRRHCGNRPITVPLLNAAWDALKKREAGRERSALLNQVERPQPETVAPKDIDALDDNAVDRLYHDSLRAYAESIRRAPGVLA